MYKNIINSSCCINGCIKEKIELSRKKLNKIVLEREENLLDPEVIRLSEYLDDLIINFNKIHDNNCIINLYDISGIHSNFYYYGENHLFINMIKYINCGIKNNEIIYVSMQHNLYNKLLGYLNNYKITSHNIKFYSVKELILSNRIGGLEGLKNTINIYTTEALENGYNGIRWIGQPTYAIQETSKQDFLDWELNLTEALLNTQTSLICIYDYYDYTNNKEVINDRIIKESFDTHSHILSKFYLKKYNKLL